MIYNAEYLRWEISDAEISRVKVTSWTDGFLVAGESGLGTAWKSRSPKLLRERAVEYMALADYIDRLDREAEAEALGRVEITVELTPEQAAAVRAGMIMNFSISEEKPK